MTQVQRSFHSVCRAAALLWGTRGAEWIRERLSAAKVPAATIEEVVGAVGNEVLADEERRGWLTEEAAAALQPDTLVFNLGRSLNLVRDATLAGYLNASDEQRFRDRLAALVLLTVDGWPAYARSFIDGMALWRGGAGLTGAIYDKSVRSSIEWLTTDPASPWRSAGWP
jgi:hypothetical protein